MIEMLCYFLFCGSKLEREGRTVEEVGTLIRIRAHEKALRTYLKTLIARLIFIRRIQLNKSSVWRLLRYFLSTAPPAGTFQYV